MSEAPELEEFAAGLKTPEYQLLVKPHTDLGRARTIGFYLVDLRNEPEFSEKYVDDMPMGQNPSERDLVLRGQEDDLCIPLHLGVSVLRTLVHKVGSIADLAQVDATELGAFSVRVSRGWEGTYTTYASAEKEVEELEGMQLW